MKMENHPSMTCRLKIVFIIIWKVAGELVSLKNITVGSNSPSGVRKAAFHLSPGFMRMLLYPQHMSNLVKSVHPASQSTTDGISEDTFLFLFVHLFSGL